ncbi:MAG: methylmalonyl Co-A mutase-associated GTPase MeaB, partial [Terriglobales bacterium]
MLSMARRDDGWRPPIVRTVATEGTGIGELKAVIGTYREFLQEGERGRERRRQRWRQRLERMLRDRAYEQLVAPRVAEAEWRQWAAEVDARKRDPFTLADEILARSSGG